MIFYKYILIMIFTLHRFKADISPIKVDGGLDTLSPCSVGITFSIKLNNTSYDSYNIDITPDRCCIDGDKDCDVLRILGGCTCYLPGDKTKILKLVAPILDPYERQGYCTLYIDSKSNNQINKRQVVKINFDTYLDNIKTPPGIKRCTGKDEDPLNDCRPVDCDVFYNGKRPYFNRKLKRCVNVPHCFVDDEIHTETIYNPVNNRCITKSIVKRDIKNLKRLSNQKDNGRTAKDLIIIRKSKNGSDSVEDVNIVKLTTPMPHPKTVVSETQKKGYCAVDRFIINYFKNNKWILIVLCTIAAVQSVLLCVMCCLKRSCKCPKEKKTQKLFDYRQDMSITTPLISTSNINTETKDCRLATKPSSKQTKPMKSYKSCDKPTTENIKPSMSEDILSKCLNRRVWRNHDEPKAITSDNIYKGDINKVVENNIKQDVDKDVNAINKNVHETRVNFEDEKTNAYSKIGGTDAVTCGVCDKTGGSSTLDLNRDSEEEMKCQNYSYYDIRADQRPNSLKTSSLCVKNSSMSYLTNEKSTQLNAPMDSVDNLLLERGYFKLIEENTRYNISNDFIKTPPLKMFNKSSKSLIKSLSSFIYKKPKSDPGKSYDEDVQLIHMCNATAHSSSNDSDFKRNLKSKNSKTS